ncbi:hypothetical protein CALCODRAFT_321664 [Calocera cornea HHB12733]|uniref:Uncharacterized protein n=1 Tax=Calocera cornea HHB12733 TaxID=1353952 RepID=A0A165F6A6_9BASI|nr:hypothetical protein CALCODRAFT_321664 [Calocera cornea HHB12733]
MAMYCTHTYFLAISVSPFSRTSLFSAFSLSSHFCILRATSYHLPEPGMVEMRQERVHGAAGMGGWKRKAGSRISSLS